MEGVIYAWPPGAGSPSSVGSSAPVDAQVPTRTVVLLTTRATCATLSLWQVVSENRYFVSEWMPGGDALREWLRSARFLQKGLAEGEGCSDDGDDEELHRALWLVGNWI